MIKPHFPPRLAGLLVFFSLVVGCNTTSAPPPQGPPIVTVAVPLERTVTDHLDFSGKTAAVESVQLRARVGGYLKQVTYKEGDEVKDGKVLFKIEPDPYQADLDRALAKVKGAEAVVAQTAAAYERMARLRPSRAVSEEEVEKALRSRDVAAASLEVAKATVAIKQLNLDFTKVLAPIDGRVDKADVTVGNLVTASLYDATVLTNIVRMEPMYVYFDVDELTLLRILRMMQQGKVGSHKDKNPEVLLGLGNGDDLPFHGTMDFVGNQVNPSTGTISVRGVFANKDWALSPGLFARVRVPVGEPHSALLVNDRAFGTNRGQKFLLVLNDRKEVVYRPVTVGALHGGLREVTAGLKAGERVIINGLLRVRPGVTVDPRPGQMQADVTAKK
jgi:RND family efflux transporter MFP subunit